MANLAEKTALPGCQAALSSRSTAAAELPTLFTPALSWSGVTPNFCDH
jgi:hypothetical protein